MRPRILSLAAILLFAAIIARAGGPAYIAGAGYNPGVEGQPILWANATVQYFTDQGDLSPILPSTQADAFVASAITPWTTAPGVGLTVTRAGHLAEDVNANNIQASGGVITAPADITPLATGTPLGIVYDYDGTVTDALLGQGAGDLSECSTNAVYGGPDNFAPTGNIAHALMVINGVCAATSTQLPDVQYRLVRVLAYIFGLGWSQANVNVLTHKPVPGSDDYQGFPVMHDLDPVNCVPISKCYSNAATPKMDDVTAMARLYPAPGGNPQTGRVWGSVYFTDSSGNATQPMQGVNVVARLLSNNQPSRQYVVTSVSGFAFSGNAGNIINGYLDPTGLPWNRWGSSDPALEGFYDLGELAIPNNQTYALYQLSVEPLDPNWSTGVEPYGPNQVAPSGSFSPVTVTVAVGSNAERDILMLGSELPQPHPGGGSGYLNPVPLPAGGAWGSWISPYGTNDFFQLDVQANRTASVAVTSLDENGAPTVSKMLPVIGIWEASDDTGNPAPAATPSAFNSTTLGMTRLDAQFYVSEAYKIGIADYRGDGRPDYAYQASVLYSDTVTPARVSLIGGVATLIGVGFKSGLQVVAGGRSAMILSQSATEMQVGLPPFAFDGTATIQVTDPVTGSFSEMIDALTYGAAATDLLQLIQGSEPSTPINSQAANPIRVRAVASDGVTPVNGATIAWSSTNGIQFSACAGATSCSVLTDGTGEAATWVTPTALGSGTITAALAPQSYSPPATQQTTLVGVSSPLDLAAIAPTSRVAQDATVGIPLTVEVLNLGVPQANVGIKYTVTNGIASLSSSTATTNSSGLATVTAQVTNLSSSVQVSACVVPANYPCQTFTVLAVPPSAWMLEPVSGTSQIVVNGQPFQPLVMRVADGSSADNPVIGVSVTFVTTLERIPRGPGGPPPGGDNFRGQSGMPVILGTSQTQVATGTDGLAAITPTVGNLGPCDAFITVTAGNSTAQFDLQSVDPVPPPPQKPKNSNPPNPTKHSASGRVAAAPSEPQDLPDVIFAVPQELPVAALFPDQMPESSPDRTADEAVAVPAPAGSLPCDPSSESCASPRSSETNPPDSPGPPLRSTGSSAASTEPLTSPGKAQ